MCITCTRHPYNHYMSSRFHHAQHIFPEIFSDALGSQEKKRIVMKRIEDHFYDYVLKNVFPLSDPELTIVGNMTRFFSWCDPEFKEVHGINVLDLSSQDEGIWAMLHNGLHYTLLRMEDLHRNLPKVVEMLTSGAQLQTVTGNVSRKRPGDWGRIYNWFRTEYAPPQAMVEYYEQNPFASLFY